MYGVNQTFSLTNAFIFFYIKGTSLKLKKKTIHCYENVGWTNAYLYGRWCFIAAFHITLHMNNLQYKCNDIN